MRTRIILVSACLAALATCALAAPEQWLQVRSPHFKLITDSNDKQGRHILDQFERMRWMFQTLFPKINVDPVSPIVVSPAKTKNASRHLSRRPIWPRGS